MRRIHEKRQAGVFPMTELTPLKTPMRDWKKASGNGY